MWVSLPENTGKAESIHELLIDYCLEYERFPLVSAEKNQYFITMKSRFGSRLLQFKMTVLFVLFGLLVGYLSFLIGTAVTSIEIFREFRQGIEGPFLEFRSRHDQDILYSAFAEEPDIGREMMATITGFIPEKHRENIRFSLYVRMTGTGEWHLLTNSENIPAENGILISPELVKDLETALERDIVDEAATFFGKSDDKNLFINITSSNDRNAYVVRMILNREGLTEFLKNEKNTLLSYSALVLLFSFVIGSLFSRTLTVPIRRLTDRARLLSRGDMEVRFPTRRMDDIGSLARSLDRMSLNLNHRFMTMQTMNRIDRAVLSSVSRRELLFKVSGYISEQFDNAGVCVLELNEEGFQVMAMVPETDLPPDRNIPMASVPEALLENMEETFELCSRTVPMLELLFPPGIIKKRTVSIPLVQEEHTVGVFIITLNRLDDRDREALGMLSDQAGVALKSLHEVEQKDALYQALLLALTRSVDAKSRWTAGHSERVADLSLALAEELKMEDRQKESVRMGALLHDIGKMGVPEAILDKPGRLTDEEFAVIRNHPAKGAAIIEDIPGYDTIRQVVRSHHEHWDGGGYPDGLSGDQIPLEARIITLADVYDAVTEDRPYRKGFSDEETVRFLKDQKGRLFDPDLLDAFLRVVAGRTAEPVR